MRGEIINGIYYKQEKEGAKLTKFSPPLGAWTINVEEVNPFEVEGFCYVTENREYRIDRSSAVTKGFKKVLGGEMKLIVPIKHWHVKEVAHAV